MALLRTIQQDLKTKKLTATTGSSIYHKVARIQVSNPVDSGEGCTFQGTAIVQSNYGKTGTHQPQYMFSFGVRGNNNLFSLTPSLLKVGDSNESTVVFEVYKDTIGFHYLYLVQPLYSYGGVITYKNIGCEEYWEKQDSPPIDYTLVWSSETGATQGVYEGGRRLLTETKAKQLYTASDDSTSRLVNLDVGLSSPFYQLEDGLRVTKQGNIIHLNGGLQHGINLKYQNIAKVPPGYEPKYKTPLHGFYNKASGEFVSIPLLLKPDGYIVMMGDRNDPATPTNMYVSGTWNIKS
ncbi:MULTISPECIES: hypothetical protein [unclassified Bacillus cereus group]|uniref:hypothetical protein n=1 Tax=unclassified Bacillus cereus group TaxID=2750818 RepID=UPI00339A7E23